MKVPIPQDWDGTTWRCVQVQWPDSQEYRAILAGFLSYLMRARYWDERTGTITQAQEIGWKIFERNVPFRSCVTLNDCPECPDNAPIGLYGLDDGLAGLENTEMPCIDITSLLKVENGILYARNACCEWVAIGSFQPGSSSVDLGDDPLNPEGDPNFVYSACGKADALIAKLRAVAQTAWDTRDNFPWQYASAFHLDHPDLEGGSLEFTNTVLLAIQLDVLTSHDDVFDTNETDRVKTWLAGILDDSPDGITSDQFGDLIDKIFQVNGGANILDPAGVMKGNFWTQALLAIGKGDAANITKMGAGTTDADCGAPPDPLNLPDFGDGSDWAYVFDVRKATLPASFTLAGTMNHTVGVGIWGDVGGTMDYTDLDFQIAPQWAAGSAQITQVAFVWKTVGDEQMDGGSTYALNMSSNLLLLSDLAVVSGDNPASAGQWTLIKALGVSITPASGPLHVGGRWFHPPQTNPPSSPDVALVCVAVGIAGTGDDPLFQLPT